MYIGNDPQLRRISDLEDALAVERKRMKKLERLLRSVKGEKLNIDEIRSRWYTDPAQHDIEALCDEVGRLEAELVTERQRLSKLEYFVKLQDHNLEIAFDDGLMYLLPDRGSDNVSGPTLSDAIDAIKEGN